MRPTISGMIAALAVATAGIAPASACGLFDCGLGYTAPVYSGCGCRGGAYAGYERLADPTYQYGAQPYPVQQYYYVNQGPTYSGPGDFAPSPTYQESALPGWSAYRHRPHHYGYNGGSYHHGYHYWGHGAPHSIRYGYHGMPHHYGYRGYPQRRYY